MKGDFDILKLEYELYSSNKRTTISIPYDKDTKCFTDGGPHLSQSAKIYILVDAEFQTVVSVTHRLQIPQARFEFLEINQMFVDNLVLSNSGENVSFKYYGKRIDSENLEVHIENPGALGVKLNGKKGDFHYAVKLQDIDLMLSFIFELTESDQQTSASSESRPLSTSEQNDTNDVVESKPSESPENVVSWNPEMIKSPPPSLCVNQMKICPSNCEWYKSFRDKNYQDINLVAVDGTHLQCHHSILTKHSTKFTEIFEESKIFPAQINIDLDSNLLKVALKFLDDKSNSISGYESNLFVFADQWNISALIEACRPVVKDSINSKKCLRSFSICF
uniref:BTB domain-containing protein n=1 Tax=Panagrolaimus superbus TaxID=310955 RepID=A0A914Z9H6_9BILA